MSVNGQKTLDRTPLTVDCAYAPDGKLQRKTERLDGDTDEYAYAFDRNGRLTDVRLNGRPLETYRYNASGQRVLQVCHHGGLRQNERQYRYKSDGRLAQAGRRSSITTATAPWASVATTTAPSFSNTAAAAAWTRRTGATAGKYATNTVR